MKTTKLPANRVFILVAALGFSACVLPCNTALGKNDQPPVLQSRIQPTFSIKQGFAVFKFEAVPAKRYIIQIAETPRGPWKPIGEPMRDDPNSRSNAEGKVPFTFVHMRDQRDRNGGYYRVVDVCRTVENLGNRCFKIRDAADQLLRELGVWTIDEVRQIEKSPVLEIQRRAEFILKDVQPRFSQIKNEVEKNLEKFLFGNEIESSNALPNIVVLRTEAIPVINKCVAKIKQGKNKKQIEEIDAQLADLFEYIRQLGPRFEVKSEKPVGPQDFGNL